MQVLTQGGWEGAGEREKERESEGGIVKRVRESSRKLIKIFPSCTSSESSGLVTGAGVDGEEAESGESSIVYDFLFSSALHKRETKFMQKFASKTASRALQDRITIFVHVASAP